MFSSLNFTIATPSVHCTETWMCTTMLREWCCLAVHWDLDVQSYAERMVMLGCAGGP